MVPFLGEYRGGPRYFWNRRPCVGSDPAPGNYDKKGLVSYFGVRGASDK